MSVHTLVDRLQRLERIEEQRYRVFTPSTKGETVYGGELLALSVVATAAADREKRVKSLHTIFVGPVRAGVPGELSVEVVNRGRNFTTLGVTITQEGRTCTRSLALLSAPRTDFIRHAAAMPTAEPPESCVPVAVPIDGWDARVDAAIDLEDPLEVGPPSLLVWSRFSISTTCDEVVSRALLCYACNAFLVATAMRPHAGVGQALAHSAIATSVASHSVTFHDAFTVSEWLLMAQESPTASGGCSYGRGDVFDENGRPVASFTQENVIRQVN